MSSLYLCCPKPKVLIFGLGGVFIKLALGSLEVQTATTALNTTSLALSILKYDDNFVHLILDEMLNNVNADGMIEVGQSTGHFHDYSQEKIYTNCLSFISINHDQELTLSYQQIY